MLAENINKLLHMHNSIPIFVENICIGTIAVVFGNVPMITIDAKYVPVKFLQNQGFLLCEETKYIKCFHNTVELEFWLNAQKYIALNPIEKIQKFPMNTR